MKELMETIISFVNEREWGQFHNGKDLSLALMLEAAELNEKFLWKQAEDVSAEAIKDELADVLIYCFQLADKYNLDIKKIMLEKLAKNAAKYPVEKAKGNAKKYTEL
ncbi:MAG: nucleotide pyrophosphohydrolase [Bacteroidales bacterium]|nr:nucleotide pyrophosphohydrolase [Bacteroidales bacterium]